MLAALGNHLWQSTAFACAVALLTLALKENRASLRHALWLAASVKFLAPLALLTAIGSQVEWRKPAAQSVQSQAAVVREISQPFAETGLSAADPPASLRSSRLPWILSALWFTGFLVNVLAWWRRWRRIRASLKTATRLELNLNLNSSRPMPALSTPTRLEPGVSGIFRPCLLLPEGITGKLTAGQLAALIEHELCHVRRRDNLVAAVHMLVEALFWFHPLVWWIEARLIEERERACDEEVLRNGGDPQDYAEGILNAVRFYLESPLPCVSGVSGGSLQRRVEEIMLNRGPRGLSLGKKLLLSAAGVAAVLGALLLGVVDAPRMHAQNGPGFEVVSVKPCPASMQSSGRLDVYPGRLRVTCLTVRNLVGTAYVVNGNPAVARVFAPDPVPDKPAWITTEGLDIDAKAAGTPNYRLMEGPLLQAVLEDRFKLKLHRESKEISVYELTVAKGGAKLHRVEAGSCAPLDRTQPSDVANPGRKSWCAMTFHGSEAGTVIEAHGLSMDRIANGLTGFLDRPVVDRTGMDGLFDLQFTYLKETSGAGGGTFKGGAGEGRGATFGPGEPSDGPGVGPSIFNALQEQLGLKLEAAKAPGEYIVIDSIERPAEN